MQIIASDSFSLAAAGSFARGFLQPLRLMDAPAAVISVAFVGLLESVRVRR